MDPDKRVRLHNLGLASKFTRSRLPVKLVLLESYDSRSEALKREIAIKMLKHSEKTQLISQYIRHAKYRKSDVLGSLHFACSLADASP